MKTKLFTFFLALVASVGTMFAEKVQIGDLYYNLDATNQTAEVTSQNSSFPYWTTTLTTANIPASLEYESVIYSVTSIGNDAFRMCTDLSSVTIPNSVTSIGKRVFAHCEGLTSITIPYSVTSIGDRAFMYCRGLTSVTIPNSVTSIGDGAFSSCTGLTSITIPSNVTSIGNSTFEYCTSLTSVTIPNSVTSIGESAFYVCTGLTSITIPSNVTSIGNYAFRDCTGLTSITIPSNVTSIGYYAFVYCSSLSSLNVESGNAAYDSRNGCNAIIESATNTLIAGCKNTTIPYSVTSIEDYAFSGCTGLTSVTIPNRVTSIGYNAFSGCTGLTSVTIPNSITSIEDYVFSGCTGLTSVTIPNSVTSIEDYAFSKCTSLLSVTIPNSVTSIGESAFSGVRNIMYTGIATGSPWGAEYVNKFLDGYFLYSDATKTTLLGCSRAVTGDITILNSVTSIEDYAFNGCTGLTSVTIPNSVTSIGNYAFFGCNGMTSVTIGNSVTSIGESAFTNCFGLTSVAIPNSVTSIGKWAFEYCTGLTSVTIPNSVTSIGDYAFNNCYSLTFVSIPNSVTSIGFGAFSYCMDLTSVTIGNGVASIGGYAFNDCTSLTSIVCEAVTPPTCGSNVFSNVDKSIPLYVPVASIDTYKAADQWKDFGTILPIPAQEAETTEEVQAIPTENTVDLTWPVVPEATNYELEIKDNGGNEVCTLVFDANGQLVSYASHAPARNNAPQYRQEAGFVFTVTGLNPGQEYTYTFTATNNSGGVLRTESGTFYTSGAQGIEEIPTNKVQSTKISRDGQVLILRGEKSYTLQGQEVR